MGCTKGTAVKEGLQGDTKKVKIGAIGYQRKSLVLWGIMTCKMWGKMVGYNRDKSKNGVR